MCRFQHALLIDIKKMQKQFITLIAGIIASLFFLPWPVSAESARSQVESGNRAFRQQDYESSLDHYDKALAAAPDSAIVLFNRGDALYKQGKYGEAVDVFEQAAAGARENNDRMLEAQSLYNMGNSAFAAGRQAARQDPERALKQYRKSSENFKSAIKLAPQLSEAAYNLEVARKAAKQVEEMIRKEQQKAREQQQQQEDMAKELENLQQRQRDAADQSRELAEAGQQEDMGNKAAEQARKQKDITAQTRAAGEQLKQFKQESTNSDSGKKAAESVKKAVANQEEAEDNLRQNNLSGAHEKQEQASRELEKALQQLTRAQDKGQEQKDSDRREADSAKQETPGKKQEQQAAGAGKGQEAEETPRPAGNLAGDSPEEIIREELENRKYRNEKGNATGYNAVDRDW